MHSFIQNIKTTPFIIRKQSKEMELFQPLKYLRFLTLIYMYDRNNICNQTKRPIPSRFLKLGSSPTSSQSMVKSSAIKTQLRVQARPIISQIIIFNQLQMPLKNSYSLQKRKYAQISVKKRAILVRLVLQQGKTLAEASRKLNIKPSTAKLIVKKYQQTGKFFMKKLKNTVKNKPPCQAQPEMNNIAIKMEEKEEFSYQQVQEQKSQGQGHQDKIPWYGYSYYPYNCQYTYYKT